MSSKELETDYIPFQCMIVAYSNRFNVEGVSTAQYYLLDILNKQGPKTAKELSEIKGISQSGISKLTRRLLDKNYVIQERQDNDRRFYKIIITNDGREFLNRVDDFGNQMINLIGQALTPAEVTAFSAMCRKITDLYIDK